MLCGDCILDGDIAICPIARCPKSLVNGPCGGAEEGRCEVVRENRCVWIEIYEKSIRNGSTGSLKKTHSPRDHSLSLHPGSMVTRKKG